MPVSERYIRKYERKFRAGDDNLTRVERTTKVATARVRVNARACEVQLELFADFCYPTRQPKRPDKRENSRNVAFSRFPEGKRVVGSGVVSPHGLTT